MANPIERAKDALTRYGRSPSLEAVESSTSPTLNQQLARNNSPFPWGLTNPEETAEIHKRQDGILRVTSGGVFTSPWEIVSEDRARELVEKANGILRVTSGLAAFKGGIFDPETASAKSS